MNRNIIGELLQKVNSLPDVTARDAALTLLLATLEFHRSGLERLMEMIAGTNDRNQLASDPLVSSLLLWHDLHPFDLETRILRTLGRPEFHSCAGHVEFISVRQGVVRVRIEGGPDFRRPSSAQLAKLPLTWHGCRSKGGKTKPACRC